MSSLRYGYVQIGGVKLFGFPEDYTLFDRGSKSQIIPTNQQPLLDPGYGVIGFSLNGWVLDADSVTGLDTLAANALESGQPLTALDTLGPKGSWTGFLERPVIKTGKAYTGGVFGLPNTIFLTQVPITFFSNEVEYL